METTFKFWQPHLMNYEKSLFAHDQMTIQDKLTILLYQETDIPKDSKVYIRK